MTYVKLTNAMRQRITQKLLAHRYDPLFEQLRAQKVVLGDKIYNVLYTEWDQMTLNSLGKDWFAQQDFFNVNFSGPKVQIPVSGTKYFKACHWERYDAIIAFDATNPLCDEWTKISQAFDKLTEQKNKTSREVRAVLNSYGSVKNLLEGWPEVREFVSHDVAPIQLPTVQITDLNEKLGLPILPTMLEGVD